MSAEKLEKTLTAALDRLQRLEEMETARNLLHRYAATLDDPSPEAVAALFVEDGVLHVPSGDFVGREGVQDFYRDRLSRDISEKRHFVTSPYTTWWGPGQVEVASYFMFTGRGEATSAIGWGTYHDRIRVNDGVALFAEKTITPHMGTDLVRGWSAI